MCSRLMNSSSGMLASLHSPIFFGAQGASNECLHEQPMGSYASLSCQKTSLVRYAYIQGASCLHNMGAAATEVDMREGRRESSIRIARGLDKGHAVWYPLDPETQSSRRFCITRANLGRISGGPDSGLFIPHLRPAR
jgi:hypothetical protein